MALKLKTHELERVPVVQRTAPTANEHELSAPTEVVDRVFTKPPGALRPVDILALQRTVGNRAVGRILAGRPDSSARGSVTIQAKLSVGPAGDKYEQEADRVARQVMSMDAQPAGPSIQRASENEEEGIQRKSSAVAITPLVQRQATPEDEEQGHTAVQRLAVSAPGIAAPSVENAIGQARGSGQALPQGVRSRMESAFGADLSGVRVHTDARADNLNRSLQARAFTTGRDLFFKRGEYNPDSRAGQELLAHELTHVMQQRGAASDQRLNREQDKQPVLTMKTARHQLIMRDLDQKAIDTALDQAVTDHKLNRLTRGELRTKTYAQAEDLTTAIAAAVRAQHHPTLPKWLKKLGFANEKGDVHYWKKATSAIKSENESRQQVTYQTHFSVFQSSVKLPPNGVNDSQADILSNLFAGDGTEGPHITLERDVTNGKPHYYYDGTELSNMSQSEKTTKPTWTNLKKKMKDVLKNEKTAAGATIDTIRDNKSV